MTISTWVKTTFERNVDGEEDLPIRVDVEDGNYAYLIFRDSGHRQVLEVDDINALITVLRKAQRIMK